LRVTQYNRERRAVGSKDNSQPQGMAPCSRKIAGTFEFKYGCKSCRGAKHTRRNTLCCAEIQGALTQFRTFLSKRFVLAGRRHRPGANPPRLNLQPLLATGNELRRFEIARPISMIGMRICPLSDSSFQVPIRMCGLAWTIGQVTDRFIGHPRQTSKHRRRRNHLARWLTE